MPLTADQQKAVESAHEPLFIQAGAGTGKTFTLTKRIAHGLSADSGHLIGSVDRLLTITFTNKAAGELIGRIRAELRARGLESESLQIDAAWISTIHAMCRRMLLTHAFDVGFDPGANMLGEDESQALSDLALDALLKDETSGALAPLIDAYGIDGATRLIRDLSKLLALAPGRRDDFDLGPAPKSGVHITQQVGSLLDFYMRACESVDEIGVDGRRPSYAANRDKMGDVVTLLQDWLVMQGGESSWIQVNELLDQVAPPSGGNLAQPFKDIFNECKAALNEFKAQAESAIAYELLNDALDMACEHQKRHQQLKRSKGALDTDDLIIAAYRLLEEDDQVAGAYREQFDSIMVDEFQDTDNLQVGIVTRLCDSQLSTLATVGDAQQSIYGFRGADLEVYQMTRDRMRACGSNEVQLTINYRSQPDILRYVEDVFSRPEAFGGAFLRVSSGRKPDSDPAWLPADEPRVKILLSAGHKNPEGRGSVTRDRLRRTDACALADEFERLHEQGASYGDMAILMSSTKDTRAGSYLREFRRRGIPCVISGGSDFFMQPEVGHISMLLRVLANQDDDEALFDVLGSDMFCADDDELLALSVIAKQKLKLLPDEARSKPSLYDALSFYVQDPDLPKSDSLTRAFETINLALEQVVHVPIAQVVRDVVRLSGWQATLADRGIEGGAVYANIERACDMIADHEAISGHAPFATSEYFRNLVKLAHEGSGGRSKLGALVSSRNDAVRIMTIHSSKGLEFPIVAVAEFEKSSKAGEGKLISLSEGGKRYLALGAAGKSAMAGVQDSLAADAGSFTRASTTLQHRAYANVLADQREVEEQLRLLYVALTRARDKLVLVAHDGSFASTGKLSRGLTCDCLEAAFGEQIPTTDAIVKTDAGALVELSITNVPYNDTNEDGADNQISLVVEHSNASFATPPRMSAAALAQESIYSYSSIAKRRAPHIEPSEFSINLRDRTRDAKTVSRVGSAFHLVAQWLALNAGAGKQAIERRMTAAIRRWQLSPEEEGRLADAVAAWVSSRRFDQVMGFAKRFAEYAFCVDVEGVALEGYIDLMCLDDEGGALVIDYKTGTSGQDEDLHERYRLQAYCYCYALLSTGVCDHVDMVFVRPEADMEEVTFSFDTADVPVLVQRILS